MAGSVGSWAGGRGRARTEQVFIGVHVVTELSEAQGRGEGLTGQEACNQRSEQNRQSCRK